MLIIQYFIIFVNIITRAYFNYRWYCT